MMLLNLQCPECILNAIEGKTSKAIDGTTFTVPYEPVLDHGIYKVNCSNNHTDSRVILRNINFEILFDYSINALADGYYREAVSSFTSAMERFFEFFIKVVLKASGSDFVDIDKTWKLISNQSERQLGAYIILYTQTFSESPKLLSNNKEVPFRNSVIHKGYIPKKEEAVQFGEKVMNIMESSLIKLKKKYPKEVEEVFEYYSYSGQANPFIEIEEKTLNTKFKTLGINILTAIDVMNGREKNEDDGRKGNIDNQIERVLRERNPRKMVLKNELPDKNKKFN